MPGPCVFRFAPSPNGELHLGHALSALTGYDLAQRSGGRFLIRIEDIDTGRSRQDHVHQILEDLAWLGITWEEPVLRQSTRFEAYRLAADDLLQRGLLYPCLATRSEIAAATGAVSEADPDGIPIYPGLYANPPDALTLQRMANGEPYALRIDMSRAMSEVQHLLNGRPLTFTELDEDGNARIVAAQPARWGDAVIIRKDIPASYHLAVVIDDAFQGVTHVTRGMDLFTATDLQRLLQVLLGLPAPVYHHHRLLLDHDGRKLSKSAGAETLRGLREGGLSVEQIRKWISGRT